jgi:hypothetical protein
MGMNHLKISVPKFLYFKVFVRLTIRDNLHTQNLMIGFVVDTLYFSIVKTAQCTFYSIY